MTTASVGRRARRAAREQAPMTPQERGDTIVHLARQLVHVAAHDLSVSGATIVLPDGSTLFLSVREAMQMIGAAPAAGRA